MAQPGAHGVVTCPPPGPWGYSPRGSHVGARRDFPSARANFAALGCGARRPEGRGEVVVAVRGGGAAVLKLSLAPAAHAPGTPPPSIPSLSRQKESLRNRTSGASHQPSAAGCPEPIPGDHQSAVQEGARVRAPPGKPGRAVSERRGCAAPDRRLHRARVEPAPPKRRKLSGVGPRGGMEAASEKAHTGKAKVPGGRLLPLQVVHCGLQTASLRTRSLGLAAGFREQIPSLATSPRREPSSPSSTPSAAESPRSPLAFPEQLPDREPRRR